MATINQTKESIEWLFSHVRSIKAAAAQRRIITQNSERSRDATVIGKMYFFRYDPKMKKTLPIYDTFPLVFPIERYSDGFLGLNLHYLNGDERTWLLKALSDFRTSKTITNRTRLQLTYRVLSATKRLATVTKPCIKRYLFKQVRSKFIEVLPSEWDKAINLPVAIWKYN